MDEIDTIIEAHDHTEYNWVNGSCFEDGTTCINCSSHGVPVRKMFEWLAFGIPRHGHNCEGDCSCRLEGEQ